MKNWRSKQDTIARSLIYDYVSKSIDRKFLSKPYTAFFFIFAKCFPCVRVRYWLMGNNRSAYEYIVLAWRWIEDTYFYLTCGSPFKNSFIEEGLHLLFEPCRKARQHRSTSRNQNCIVELLSEIQVSALESNYSYCNALEQHFSTTWQLQTGNIRIHQDLRSFKAFPANLDLVAIRKNKLSESQSMYLSWKQV